MTARLSIAVALLLLAASSGCLDHCEHGVPLYLDCESNPWGGYSHGDVYWYDECNERVRRAWQCDHGDCRISRARGPICECDHNWEGQSCNLCPEPYDEDDDCQ